jgi:large subunit ribosomal protein L4
MGDASSGIRESLPSRPLYMDHERFEEPPLSPGRGGAPIFAITPRDYAQLLPRKVRSLGLTIALSSKLSAGLLKVVPDFNEPQWEGTNAARRALTNEMVWTKVPNEEFEEAEIIERFGRQKDLSVLFVPSPMKDPEAQEGFERVVRNLQGVEVVELDELQVYHVLKYKWVVMERETAEVLSGLQGFEGSELEDLVQVPDAGLAEGQARV